MNRQISLMLVLLLLSLMLVGQAQDEVTEEEISEAERLLMLLSGNLREWDNERFGAYLNYQIPGSTFVMDIMAQRPQGELKAQARVSHKFSKNSAARLARLDFLSPEELAGDVYIIRSNEDNRRLSEVFFWNPDLVSALKIDGNFEVFGDANVFEVTGLVIGDGQYFINGRSFSEIEPTVPAPEIILFFGEGNDARRVTADAKLAEFDIVPIAARRETVPFPRIKVVAFLGGTTKLYQVQLMDESGDLLHTISYDWRTNRELPIEQAQQGFRPFYAETQVVENHVIPGNITTLTINNIQIQEFEEAFFDPDQLGP